jgi:ankyrin repeat protein
VRNRKIYSESINILFLEAARYYEENRLKVLLKYFFKNNFYHNREMLLNELLCKASAYENLYKVETFLLSCGASYLYNDEIYLKNACWQEKFNIFDYLINNGLDINTEGERLLEYSCMYGKLRAAEFLLLRGVKGIRAVCELYNMHKFEGAEFILKKGIDKNAALLKACELGYFLACKHLIRAGASIHERDENPLILAIINGHLPIIKLLIENGAYINKNVILTACTTENDRVDILNYLFLKCSKTVFYDTNFSSISHQVRNFKISHLLLKLYAHRPFS